MNEVYEKVKTPNKYGLVMVPDDASKMVDSPSVYQNGDTWYMSYIVFDGQGYETMLAVSSDLLHWEAKGKLLSFTENTWDANQKAGYIALQAYEWGGSYDLIHWTLWAGEDLIAPSEPYDAQYAHKPCVIYWNGVVYHFYCAVTTHNGQEQRAIALATSRDLGKSSLTFPED